jgi:hypothetical protein
MARKIPGGLFFTDECRMILFISAAVKHSGKSGRKRRISAALRYFPS